MDVRVSVQGKGGGPLSGSPILVEVRVDDWRGMAHKADDLAEELGQTAETLLVAAMREQRVLEQTRAERMVEGRPKDYENLRRCAGFYEPWKVWSDGVYTPEMLGPLLPFLENMSAALGQPDEDWLADRDEMAILEQIALRVSEITDALASHLTPEQLATFDETYGTFFAPDDGERVTGAEAITAAVDELQQADAEPQATAPANQCPECLGIRSDGSEFHLGTCSRHADWVEREQVEALGSSARRETRRCPQIGEHEPHIWTSKDIRYQCHGEVF